MWENDFDNGIVIYFMVCVIYQYNGTILLFTYCMISIKCRNHKAQKLPVYSFKVVHCLLISPRYIHKNYSDSFFVFLMSLVKGQ